MNKLAGMPQNLYYERFLTAFRYLLDRDWKRRQKALSIDTGISPGFISDIKNGRTEASDAIQALFAEKMGYKNFDDFINLGKSIIETGEPPPTDNLIQRDNKVVVFPKNGNGASRELDHNHLRKEIMHENLDVILNSGDIQLIAAIESNLISFRQTVELKNKVDTLEKNMERMKTHMNKIFANDV